MTTLFGFLIDVLPYILGGILGHTLCKWWIDWLNRRAMERWKKDVEQRRKKEASNEN